MKTTITLHKLYKFRKTWKKKKAHRAVALMNKVINANSFKDKVLNYEFTDRRYRSEVGGVWEEIQDNNRIYDILKKGNEQYGDQQDDYAWMLKIKLGRFLSQVGRREKDLIVTQNWFVRSSTDARLAAHWFHEYAHVLGFHHDFDHSHDRDHSIPYALGTIVEEVLAEMSEA